MHNRPDRLTNCQLKVFKSTINTVVPLLVCIPIILLCSCDSIESHFSKKGKVLPKSTVSVDELQNQLDEFEEIFTSRTKTAAAEIDRLSEDPKAIKMTLLWRSRAIAALHNIREQPQPIMVLVDSWLLCTRIGNFIESGEASNAFGDFQHIATDTVKELEDQIEDIARKVLSEELFDQTSTGLKTMALAHPIQSGFGKTLMYSTQTKTEEPGLFKSLINIPLSPVRALEGVDRTPAAIYDFSKTTQRMTDVVQELPETIRWQLLLLLYDLEETNMANSFLKSLQNIAESSAKLSAFAEQVPALLEDSSESQEQIRQTLQQVNESATQLRKLLDAAQQTANVFSQTAQSVDSAASSWKEAAQATNEAIKRLKPQTSKSGAEPVEKANLKETAQAIKEAANEIKLVGEKLPSQAERIVKQINSLTLRIMIYIAILIVLIFCLSVAYFLIKNKYRSART